MSKRNILVFPCGSEIGLEIYRSLESSIHFTLIGASSVDDHGKFVYVNYIGDLPYSTDAGFIPRLKQICIDNKVDLIYPAMDSVITLLKQNENELGCKVIASDVETTQICLSKSKTYNKLKGVVPIPEVFTDEDAITQFPVFLKPDIGYGSRGVKKADNTPAVIEHLVQYPESLIMEYLPGREYTIDCFTNVKGELLFAGHRERKRISNGISVNTATEPGKKCFNDLAVAINQAITFNGAWFFQVKERIDGTLVLLEIASRLGGSSSVYRMKGVNFAMLSAFNALEVPVMITPNNYEVVMDRALDCRYVIPVTFNHVYIDFDDVIVLNGKVNLTVIAAVYHFINQGKTVHLITKHESNIQDVLKKYRLQGLFDEIIHLKKTDFKWQYIKHADSIFIDDSFAERKQVQDNLSLPVFSVDMVHSLY